MIRYISIWPGFPIPATRVVCATVWPVCLALTVAAVLAGSRSFLAIGEFAADLTGTQLADLGLRRPVGESNLRKLFSRLDAAALDLRLAAWAFTRSRRVSGRLVIAIDQKTLRGARSQVAKTLT